MTRVSTFRRWTEDDVTLLIDCIERGLSATQAGKNLKRSKSACLVKASGIGVTFSGRKRSEASAFRDRVAALDKDARYVERCLQANPFGFGRVRLVEAA